MNHILIIEDDPGCADLARRMLEGGGIRAARTTVVTDLYAGIREAKAEAPDFALLDLTLPPVPEDVTLTEGIPVLSEIAPLGVFTGSNNPDIVMRCHALGAQFCLLKQAVVAERCGVEKLAQAIVQATLNWKREHAPRPQ